MSAESVLVRGQARTIEEGVEAWKAEHGMALRVFALEDFVRLALSLADSLRRWQDRAWGDLFGGGKDYPAQEVGLGLQEGYAVALRALEAFGESVSRMNGLGYRVEGEAEYWAATADLKRLQADFLDRWPLFDVEEMEANAAAIDRGEFFTPEEARRELDAQNRA